MTAKRKVMVRLKGGIGNQLFQYAFALQLAHGRTQDVICLLDYFRSDPRHGGFALQHLLGPDVTTVEIPPAGQGWMYVNADALADVDLSALRHCAVDLFIDGYFQHAWNFRPVIDSMREMYRTRFDGAAYERRLRSCLARPTCESVVAIHLRRGDYLNPEVRQVHGIASPESMVECLSRLRATDYCAVVFSDSKAAIDLPVPAVQVSAAEPRTLAGDIDELRLMSCCDVIIASNSTFSYWAGMLSDRTRQLFIPDPWMRSGGVKTGSLLTARVRSYPTQLS